MLTLGSWGRFEDDRVKPDNDGEEKLGGAGVVLVLVKALDVFV